MKKLDLTGQRFGRLTVLKEAGRTKWKQIIWHCLCDCGNYKNIVSFSLKNGDSKSCSCFSREEAARRETTHGLSKTSTFHIWHTMRAQCYNINASSYYLYGARGIKICKRWHKFENFISDMGIRPIGKSIERRNNNKGYFPENCYWATRKEQSRNTRRNRLITYKNKTFCIAEWEERLNFSKKLIWQRLFRDHWSIEKALTTPIK